MDLRSPTHHGFQPIGTNPSSSNSNKMYENEGIPLTKVGTQSSTGARKPGAGTMTDLSIQPTFHEDEKKGFFKHGVGGKRRIKKLNSKSRKGTDGETIEVNSLGRLYNKIVNFSVVTRYFVYVLPIALLIAIPIVIFAVLKPNALFAGTGVRVYLFWTWIEIVWLSIWVSKLMAKALPYIFMFLCGVVSSGTRKYALVLKAVEIPLSMVGWAVTCLITFRVLTSSALNLHGIQKPWISVMIHLLGPALIASVLYLIEKMLVQLISINYHRRSFDGRIKESKHNIHLLGLLYEASRTLFPMYCPEFVEEDYIINDSIELRLGSSGAHKRSGSATPMRIIGDIGRVGDKITSIFGNIASEITGKEVFNPNSAHSIVVEALEKTRSSEALAKRLWMSFVVEGKEALFGEDIREVLGPARKDEADEAMSVLDHDGNGDVSLDEMIMKIVEIGRDRKAISASMRDVGQAIGVLDQVLVTILFVITIFIFVAFQDTNFVTTLATAGTTLLSLSFVFAATTQEFLGSCIFLFVKHPYDVGDRVDIVGPEKEFLVVEQISLLFTIFKRIDSMKMVQVPNIVLNNLWIENITRSKAMKEQLDMSISFDTSLEDIETLRTEMESFVRHPDNSRDFQPDIILEATGIGNMDKLQLKVEIRHKSNWHNETVRASRRSKFMCALVLALRKVPIYAPGGGGEPLGGPNNPSYSVAITDDWATSAREKAAKTKEGKRLIPTPAPDTGKSSSAELGTQAEQDAAVQLNQRRPTADDSAAVWNSRGDDKTLDGEEEKRDASLERRRSNDIEAVRQGLLKRESTRGRRRPGEGIPPVPSAYGQSGAKLTAASPSNEARFRSTSQILDEEREVGVSAQRTQTNQSYWGNEPYQLQAAQPQYQSLQGAPQQQTLTNQRVGGAQQSQNPYRGQQGYGQSATTPGVGGAAGAAAGASAAAGAGASGTGAYM